MILMPFTSASYLPDSRKLTLVINNGIYLHNAIYQFRISGSGTVMDEGGSRLDGDNDGFAGGDYLFTFSISKKPATPLLSAPSSGSFSNDNTPQFAWQPAALASTYELVVAKDSGFTNKVLTQTAIPGTSFTPSALPDGKYYWRVRAFNMFGSAGSWSGRNLSVDTLPPAVPKLDKPADLGASRGVPVFYWLAASGAKYYRLRLTDTLGGELYTSANLTGLNHRPPEQPLGVLLWQTQSGDAAGNWSAWSAPRSLLIRPRIPAAPTLLAPANGLL